MPQETLFNFSIDLVQPLLCALSSVLIRRDLSFQFRNTIFSGAKLTRELLSRFQRVSIVLFGYASCFLKKMEDRLPRFVESIPPLELVPLSVGANGTTDFVWASPFTVGSLMFTPPSSEPGAHLTDKTTKTQQD